MVGQHKFMSTMSVVLPVLSVTMLRRCWDDVRRLPEAQQDDLYASLLRCAVIAMEARRAAAAAITQSIGAEARGS